MTEANIPDSPTWNRTQTLDRLGGDEALLLELIGIFAEESPKLVQKLRDAISISDAETIMRGGHSIKGELSCLGGVAAAKIAQELESMGQKNQLSGAPEALLRLENELATLNLLMAGTSTP